MQTVSRGATLPGAWQLQRHGQTTRHSVLGQKMAVRPGLLSFPIFCGRKWCNMAWYDWNIGYSRHNFSHRMAMFECCWFMFLRRWAWQTVFWEFSHVSRYVGNSTVSRWCFPNFHMAPWSQSCENSWFLYSDGSIWLGFTRQICSILVKRNSWFAWPGPGWLLYKHLLQGPRCHIAMDGCWKPAGHGRHLTYVAVRSLNTMVVVFATQGKPIYI